MADLEDKAQLVYNGMTPTPKKSFDDWLHTDYIHKSKISDQETAVTGALTLYNKSAQIYLGANGPSKLID